MGIASTGVHYVKCPPLGYHGRGLTASLLFTLLDRLATSSAGLNSLTHSLLYDSAHW